MDFSKLIIPPVNLKIVRRNGVFRVFDPLRKEYFCLTEEEFIRQIFVAWMIDNLGYPASLMANEIGIRLNDTFKRCDTVVFNSDGQPLMIIEFKAPKINLNQEVFNQIVRYNMALKAKYLVVSNGYKNYCCKVDYDSNKIQFVEEFPSFRDIKED
ncbi:MAG: type I restriction enzyme HsdR N-terminal domain-containing protein [Muribaculaceae bacterium]|nr:type I restriction enzyme HsdR N-terminal domain-containing protein [Muribaculaceae bacterium]